MNIKDYVRRNFKPIYRILQKTRRKFEGILYREKKVSFGELNPDKTFYIIRNKNHGIGLMAYYMSVIGDIYYAEKKGWIPIIDMKNYENPYLEASLVGKENAWEYYFKQPSTYSLDEAYKSKNVVLSYGFTSRTGSPMSLYQSILDNPEYIEIAQNKMLFSDEIRKAIDAEYEKLFPKEGKVLGVSSRGTDMLNFPGHSRLPTTLQLINISREKKIEFGCEFIFLATEEQSVIDQFREAFGDKLIVDNRMRYDGFKNSSKSVLVDMHFERDNDSYLKGKEYLTTVALLAKCDCMIGTLIGSTLGAICINGNKYQNYEIIDLGQY